MNRKKKMIWLVEDDRATRRLLIHFLTKNTNEYQFEEYEYAENMLEEIIKAPKPINPIELDFHIRSLFKEYELKYQLKKSMSIYSALFNESIDMIFVTNPEGKFVDINPSGIKLLGYSSKEEILNIDIMSNFYVVPKDRERFKEEITTHGFVRDFQTKISFQAKPVGSGWNGTIDNPTFTLTEEHRGLVADWAFQQEEINSYCVGQLIKK